MKITLNKIGKKYEGRNEFTLKNIDLVIQDKAFCVILGPSGCGKTTLLRMIAGLNSVTEGDLIFGERKVNKVPSNDRDIAMVFQSYALYPHMTVYQNMAFSLSMRKVNKSIIHERVMDAAKILNIEEYLYSKPSDISGGQRQRVALGRAIVRKPAIFLMDEPLSNLDAKLREHMRVELVKLHKKLEATTIYVTHDQVEAMTMATQIVLMNEGIIQQVGTPEEFYNKPANLFVAKFIGSPSMNIFKGRLENDTFISDDKKLKISINLQELNLENKNINLHNNRIHLGVRCERFVECSLEEANFIGKVDVIEMLGKEKILYIRKNNDQHFIISVPGYHDYVEGETYGFKVESDALHIFDATGKIRLN